MLMRRYKVHPAAEVFPLLSDDELQKLADDIKERGQDEPITVWGTKNILVDGRNREAACRMAGVNPTVNEREFKDDADVARFVVSANVRRRHMNASQLAMAGARLEPFYAAAAKENKGGRPRKPEANLPQVSRGATVARADQSRDDAANDVGVSPRLVQDAKTVQAKAAPEVVKAVDAGTMAVSAAAKLASLPLDDQRAVVAKIQAGEAKNAQQAMRRIEEEKRVAVAPSDRPDAQILVGDCIEHLGAMAAGSVHCVATDPPYGIDVHNTRRGAADYADGWEYTAELLQLTCAALERVCTSDAHLYFFAGYTHAHDVKRILAEHFDVQDNPIIWVKGNHTMCDFSQWYPNKHEYIWFAKQRGSRRKLARCIPDVIECSAERSSTHSAEKPTLLLRTLIENSTVAGEHVLDPFAGSGSTGVAALALARAFTGIELEEKWAGVARSRL